MERRSALKNIGIVFGYTITAPTLIGVLQSCQDRTQFADWKPRFFGKDKGMAFAKMLDVIIPRTDSVSATDVNVHRFIDELISTCLPQEQQNLFKETMDVFMEKVLTKAEKESPAKLDEDDFTPLLKVYLARISENEQKKIKDFNSDYIAAQRKGESIELNGELASFAFAQQVRNLAIMGYKASEYVGKKLMVYLPVPGEFIPCESIEVLTKGKAWSLG